MNASQYYSQMKDLAKAKREEFGIVTAEINIPLIQKIYKSEGVKIDRRKSLSRKIRAAYFCDGSDCSVLLNSSLPREPKLFSLVHELKHHFVDRDLIENGEVQCGDYNENEIIEKGAEVFAAEFIFPESEMRELISSMGISRKNCEAKSIVDIKRKKVAPVSYMFIKKRFEFLGLIQPGVFDDVKFEKLEEDIYGKPIYKQPWFQAKRKKKAALI